MMVKRILLAYDGSEASSKAFEWASDMAKRYQAELHVITVAPIPEVADEVESEAFIEQSRQQHQKVLDRLKQRATHAGVAIHTQLQVGHAARHILEQASALKADMLVVGHRGHGAFERWRLGSVTQRVIAYAECAVMVVR